jgi:cyclophilin family peptidyl-prolyl cis-trans isomerase
MPRKKQIVQKQKRNKVYREGEFSGAAADIKPKGFFRFFGNYPLFAAIGAVALIGGLAISAVYSGGSPVRNERGSVRGEGLIRTTPEPGETSTTGAAPLIKSYPAPPALTIDRAKTYKATIKTSKGDIEVELLDDQAPETVNNFVFLAKDGFYDGVTFHRVLPDFVAQAGDPTGTGSGGPGYDLPAEVTQATFEEGTLAMAKPNEAGAPNNGSQFFITLSDAPTLEGKATAFGRVIAGQDVLDQLTARDPDREQEPAPGDRIESITITES